MLKSLKHGGSWRIRTSDQLVKSQTKKTEVVSYFQCIKEKLASSASYIFDRLASLSINELQNVLIRTATACTLLTVPSISSAELNTIKLFAGQALLSKPENGRWNQTGGDLSWYLDREVTQYGIGLGGRVFSWLDYSIEYNDRGTHRGGGQFTSDENYVQGDYTPLYAANYRMDTKAVVLTLDPTLRLGKFEGYLRIGYEYFDAKIQFDERIYESATEPEHTKTIKHRNKELVAYRGIGARYRFSGYALGVDTYAVTERVDENPGKHHEPRYGVCAVLEIGL